VPVCKGFVGQGGNKLERLYSVKAAAKKLGGISVWTIHSWLSKGKMHRTKVGGRTMIRESELRKMVQDGHKSASTEWPQEGH
jgi:hypothetical protein